MSDSADLSDLEPEQLIERGQTYDHTEHGQVEVTGIWKGVHQVDSAHNAAETGIIIVRYSTEQGQRSVTELTDTLDDFLESIDESY